MNYHTKQKTTSMLARFTTKSVTADQWHQIISHVSSEAISHLEASAEGVKIQQPKLQAPRTHECEPCALSKAQCIISRVTAKAEPSTRPFEHVTFDLIQHNQTYNGDQWTVHAACDLTSFNIVFTTRYKTATPDILTQILRLVERRYGQKVVFIRTDGKKTLTKAYQNELTSQGICQRTARKGQVGMARKARWMLWRKVRSTSGSYHVYILAS